MGTITPTVDSQGNYTRYTWTLTAADPTANPAGPIGHRNDKTVDLNEAGGSGWGTATIAIHGDLEVEGAGNFKLLNTVPDTTDLSFAAADSTKQFAILANVNRIKPVVTTGTLGAAGVTITLLVTSGRELAV